MKHTAAMLAAVAAVVVSTSAPAAAQTTGFGAGQFVFFGEIGFQGDVGGSVNSSGVGRVGGVNAEMDANSWAERYDAALVVRFGVGYNFSDTSQVFATTHWEQAEADQAEVGLFGGQPLMANFSDYQGWGIDVGYRHFAPTTSRVKPFAQVALGFVRIQQISANLVAQPSFIADEVPFYADSWVIQWRLGGGFTTAFTERFGLQVSADLQYAGVLNDRSGLGALGFERINDAGNKWSLPVTGGIYIKF